MKLVESALELFGRNQGFIKSLRHQERTELLSGHLLTGSSLRSDVHRQPHSVWRDVDARLNQHPSPIHKGTTVDRGDNEILPDLLTAGLHLHLNRTHHAPRRENFSKNGESSNCLLYTSDAADE